jgi:hypothetical protein
MSFSVFDCPHGAGWLIIATGGQSKTEKDMYAKLCCMGSRK